MYRSEIIYRKNLNGTWFGDYFSRDLITDKVYKGKIALVIKQSFLNLTITSYTEKYISYSYAESILKEKEKCQLVYLYSQNEFDPTDETSRKGTSELHITSEAQTIKLFGEFWTNSNSKGKLNVIRSSRKHVESFYEAKSEYENDNKN